jgi:hypothetical protein
MRGIPETASETEAGRGEDDASGGGGGRGEPRLLPGRRIVGAAVAAVAIVAAVVALADGGRDGPLTAGDAPTAGRSPTATGGRTDAAPADDPTVAAGPTTSPVDPGAPAGGERQVRWGDEVAGRSASTTTSTTLAPGTGAEAFTTPSRADAVLALDSDGLAVELVWAHQALYFRRIDDVGSLPGDPPDGFGSASAAGWGAVDGPACLTWGGGAHVFADVGGRGFSYGLAGSAIARIDVVTADGARSAATLGPPVDGGMRPWLAAHPQVDVVGVDGFDSAGQRVASAGAGAATGDGATPGVSAGCG